MKSPLESRIENLELLILTISNSVIDILKNSTDEELEEAQKILPFIASIFRETHKEITGKQIEFPDFDKLPRIIREKIEIHNPRKEH